ncbi:MAG: hypothetical protein JWQ79_3600 [Mucilaginibacter sp.]|nr:hypothetical protein [Mucilaginibacter sp.]
MKLIKFFIAIVLFANSVQVFAKNLNSPTDSTIATKRIEVITNKNVELFGLMLQLDNGPYLAQHSKDSVTIDGKRVSVLVWRAKTYINYQRYKKFDTCAIMKAFRNYRSRHLWDDFFIGFLLEVDEVPYARINAGTDDKVLRSFSQKGDLEKGTKNATEFLNMLNDFYEQVDFDSYLKENQVYYDLARANVEKNLPPGNLIPVMEAFYQKSFNGYIMVPSLNIPSGQNYGHMNHKTQIIYNTFGPSTLQTFDPKDPKIGYDQPRHIRDLSVHEFGHSFVNPAIDKVPDTLIESSAYLYKPIEETMSKQSYPNWKICLYEHFVRAGEVMIARKLGDQITADRILNESPKSGYIYLPEIVSELEKYDRNRQQYTSYDAFVPLVVERLKQLHHQ